MVRSKPERTLLEKIICLENNNTHEYSKSYQQNRR